MKRIIVSTITAVAIVILTSATTIHFYEANKSTGESEQMGGYYIFVDSKPVMEYDFLGTVKGGAGAFTSGQYTEVRDGLIKKAQKDFPEGNGLILNLCNGCVDKADVVKFKD